jgi:hypothetical protein
MALTLSPLGVEENHNVIRYNLCIFSRRKSYLDRNVHFFYIKKPTNRNELVYRLDENKKMTCSCLDHMEEREKLERFLKHFNSKN